jgi:hypothetical protein
MVTVVMMVLSGEGDYLSLVEVCSGLVLGPDRLDDARLLSSSIMLRLMNSRDEGALLMAYMVCCSVGPQKVHLVVWCLAWQAR